ncbi:MAG: helix-turn-helix transcriptional regulator [Clostridia bacterium]|nr:helix-turn-helix transcriptional regulator [Clostridia bacterium]
MKEDTISIRLKDLRLENNLSQQKLAKLIGVTQKAIDFWEKGINEPKASYIIKLAKYFQVSTDYLLGVED